jgi:hypothetical protein
VSEIDFNCTCESISGYSTLLTLRTRMMRRLGYSAQASNPPPGMADLLDDYLRSAQTILYTKNSALRTERFYRWTMVAGTRYYGVSDQDSAGEFTDITCGKGLDAYGVSWVGLEDLNGAWYPMSEGIDPVLYTNSTQEGIPSRYEIRSCIEVFPAPNAAYHLWIKGRFELEAFTSDTDRTTIDSELVFLLALGNAKLHYGQADAQATLTQAGNYLSDLKAGKYTTARFIPGTRRSVPPPQPTMTVFV